MAEDVVDLFDSPADAVVLPSSVITDETSLMEEQSIPESSKLISDDISRAIGGEIVKSVMFKEEANIILPNYVIDFRGLDQIYEFQMSALDALIHEDGNVALYVCTNAGLAKLGFGIDSILDRILAVAIDKLFDRKCKLYRNFELGKPLMVVSHKDVTKMRLSI